MRPGIMLGKVQHLFSGATDMAIKARPHNPQGDEGKEALLERAKALNEAAEMVLANSREHDGGPLPLEEAKRMFDRAIEEARASQLKWIEEFGPPPGWVRAEDQVDGSAVETHTDSKPRAEKEAPMSDSVTHAELDAKMETAAARMDLRLAQFDKDMRGVVGEMRQEMNEFRLEIQPLKNMKASIWGSTAVIVGAIFAAVALAFGAFDSGRDTSQALQEMRQQSFETRQLLEQVKAQQAAQPVPQVPPPAAPAPQQ